MAAVYPIDTIKSRVQASVGGRVVATTTTTAMRSISARGFYAGLPTCLARAAPVNAAILVTHGLAMDLLARAFPD